MKSFNMRRLILTQRSRLIILLCGLVVSIWAGFSLSSYLSLRKQSQELLDKQVMQIAVIMAETSLLKKGEVIVDNKTQHFISPDYLPLAYAMFVEGEAVRRTNYGPELKLSVPYGFSDMQIEDKVWRVYRLDTRSSQTKTDVIVAFDYKLQNLLVKPMVRMLIGHFLLEIVVILSAIVVSVRWVDGSMRKIIRRIAHMKVDSLENIDIKGLPPEWKPLVMSFNQLLKKLRQSRDIEREFLSNAAHELRTPLAAVRMQAQIALEERDATKAREMLRKMMQGVDRASHAVSQLLLMAKLDALAKPELEDVRVGEEVENVIQDLAELSQSRNIEINNQIPTNHTLRANTVLFGILLRNLLDNAIRYSPEATQVTVTGRSTDEGYCLEVRDQGPGIPIEWRTKVRQRFLRMPGAPSTGIGLGLALVQRIVDMHGATSVIEDALEEQGMVFKIVFQNNN